MHFKVSPKSVFVLSNMLKRALASYESAKSAILLSKVLTQQKRGWSLLWQTIVTLKMHCGLPRPSHTHRSDFTWCTHTQRTLSQFTASWLLILSWHPHLCGTVTSNRLHPFNNKSARKLNRKWHRKVLIAPIKVKSDLLSYFYGSDVAVYLSECAKSIPCIQKCICIIHGHLPFLMHLFKNDSTCNWYLVHLKGEGGF